MEATEKVRSLTQSTEILKYFQTALVPLILLFFTLLQPFEGNRIGTLISILVRRLLKPKEAKKLVQSATANQSYFIYQLAVKKCNIYHPAFKKKETGLDQVRETSKSARELPFGPVFHKDRSEWMIDNEI